MRITVATDGSALNNPKGPGGWAWVIDDKSWNAGSVQQGTSVMMEVYAIIKALEEIPEHLNLLILTDSKSCVDMLGTDGNSPTMKTWVQRKWRNRDGSQPRSLKLYAKLHSLILSRRGSVVFQWVQGHNGHPLNTIADKMCTTASNYRLLGREFSGGPGFVRTRRVNAASDSKVSVPTIQKKRTSSPASKNKPVVKRRRTPPAVIITSFDDEGPLMPEKPNLDVGKVVYCESCNAPIHPFTQSCRCFTS